MVWKALCRDDSLAASIILNVRFDRCEWSICRNSLKVTNIMCSPERWNGSVSREFKHWHSQWDEKWSSIMTDTNSNYGKSIFIYLFKYLFRKMVKFIHLHFCSNYNIFEKKNVVASIRTMFKRTKRWMFVSLPLEQQFFHLIINAKVLLRTTRLCKFPSTWRYANFSL